MVQQPAAGPEQVVQPGDITGRLFAAHVFGHADGADGVEGAVVHVAVILDLISILSVGPASAAALLRARTACSLESVTPTTLTP